MNQALNHAHFCNVLVKPVYVKVLKEGENKFRVVAYFSFLLLWQTHSHELIPSKRCLKKKGAQPPKFLIILRRVA